MVTTNKTFKCEFKYCGEKFYSNTHLHLNFVDWKKQLAVKSDQEVAPEVKCLDRVSEVEEGLGTDVSNHVVGEVELGEEGEGGEGVGAEGAQLIPAQDEHLQAVARAEHLK